MTTKGKKYQIEICGQRNESVIFTPAGRGKKVRGRWSFSKVSGKGQAAPLRELSAIGAFPGQVIELDVEEGVGRIFDPLTTDADAKKKMEDIKHVYKNYQAILGPFPKGAEESVTNDMSVDEVKTWAYHMSRLVSLGLAVNYKTSPDLPKEEEIKKWEGKRVSDPGNTGNKDDKLKATEFVDVVEKKPLKGS